MSLSKLVANSDRFVDRLSPLLLDCLHPFHVEDSKNRHIFEDLMEIKTIAL